MNEETLKSFIAYCEANPEQRFRQALRNWANGEYEKDELFDIYFIKKDDSAFSKDFNIYEDTSDL